MHLELRAGMRERDIQKRGQRQKATINVLCSTAGTNRAQKGQREERGGGGGERERERERGGVIHE